MYANVGPTADKPASLCDVDPRTCNVLGGVCDYELGTCDGMPRAPTCRPLEQLGAFCASDCQCASGACGPSNTCVTATIVNPGKLADGQPCQMASECATNQCTQNKCGSANSGTCKTRGESPNPCISGNACNEDPDTTLGGALSCQPGMRTSFQGATSAQIELLTSTGAGGVLHAMSPSNTSIIVPDKTPGGQIVIGVRWSRPVGGTITSIGAFGFNPATNSLVSKPNCGTSDCYF
jgi:hypothetical protein